MVDSGVRPPSIPMRLCMVLSPVGFRGRAVPGLRKVVAANSDMVTYPLGGGKRIAGLKSCATTGAGRKSRARRPRTAGETPAPLGLSVVVQGLSPVPRGATAWLEDMQMSAFRIDQGFTDEQNQARLADLSEDFEHLGKVLARSGQDIESVVARARSFRVAIPSWAVATGGTRFGRFPLGGEPRGVFEKLEDCATINHLLRITPLVSLHIPWDKTPRPGDLKTAADNLGLSVDSMNSNTFEDQAGQKLSYKFGSLSHPDAAVRRQAVDLNLECIEIGRSLGATSLTVWIGDGGNFPGQT